MERPGLLSACLSDVARVLVRVFCRAHYYPISDPPTSVQPPIHAAEQTHNCTCPDASDLAGEVVGDALLALLRFLVLLFAAMSTKQQLSLE